MVKPDSTLEFATADSMHGESVGGPFCLALMIAWAPFEPSRVGEVALFDDESGAVILGRGGADQGMGERVFFVRQRPGSNDVRPPLSSLGLSREQLRIRVDGGKLHVERIGKCVMEVGDRRVDQAMVGPGESLLLKGQLLLYCILRPRKLEAPNTVVVDRTHAFGMPDAHGIVGESAAVWALRDQLAWIGKADGHTLLLGASGSGKELCARAVHTLSKRAHGPFVARNAATIPAGIIDAELFGNVKNYPNPGMAERPGLIGSADKGTLFLDEIGEIPQYLQANMLRVLDEGGEYHNLGGTLAKRSNFRFIGATNRAPESLKHDFAARLVLRVHIPGFDERREDIPLLVRHLLRRAHEKSAEAVERFFVDVNGVSEPNLRANLIDALLRWRYSTNIRELEALLWRAMSQCSGRIIEWPRDMQVPSVETVEPTHSMHAKNAPDVDIAEPPEDPREDEVRAALNKHQGNIVRAAKTLGLSSRYVLYRLMRKYGITAE